jgi:hypothetical protein
VVFRDSGPVMCTLAELGREAAAVAGPGHWIHGPEDLHVTIRALEPHRSRVPGDDPRLRTYIRAVNEAAQGLRPFRMRFRGLSPHPRGVAVVGHPCNDTADELRRRLGTLLERYAMPSEQGVRTDWYANLLHFAAQVPEPSALVEWCDVREDLLVGEIEFQAVELIRWCWDAAAATVRAVSLDRVGLSRSPRVG